MKQKKGQRVLAIGLDAAEPTLVRRLIEENELPALRRVLAEGTWSRIESPAHIGSGSVWPTFMTGTQPASHGIYSDWCWQPETMSLVRYHGQRLTPFWKRLAQEGVTVGLLDVPFAPFVRLSRGFEVAEWGAHDVLEGDMRCAPSELSGLVTKQGAPHPFSLNGEDALGPSDLDGLRKLGAACLEGVRLRGELAVRLIRETRTQFSLIVFTEIHHAAHQLWHTLVAGHSLYAAGGLESARNVEPTLRDILREVDRQIERLIKAAGTQATVLVFSLHGMRPARGLPVFLEPLLCQMGLARIASWKTQSWPERASSLLAAFKRRTPASLKRLYYRTLPEEMTHHLAQPTMIPAYDWNVTRAFSLPTDQHGWIRMNLAGREAKGCVPRSRYEETCREIEEMMRELATEDGHALVRDVIRTAELAENAPPRYLPDLIIHWHDSAFRSPVKIRGLSLETQLAAMRLTGQHASDGFCIFKDEQESVPETISAQEMHRIITGALARPARCDLDGTLTGQ